jgi:hypothetical protein
MLSKDFCDKQRPFFFFAVRRTGANEGSGGQAARRNGVFVLAADPLAGKATSTLRASSPAAK